MSFFSDDEDDLMDLAKFDSMVETAAALQERSQKEEEKEEGRGVESAAAAENAKRSATTTTNNTQMMIRKENFGGEQNVFSGEAGAHISNSNAAPATMKQQSIARMFVTTTTDTKSDTNDTSTVSYTHLTLPTKRIV